MVIQLLQGPHRAGNPVWDTVAFTLATAAVSRLYGDKLSFDLKPITDRQRTDAIQYSDNAADMVARHYYADRRTTNSARGIERHHHPRWAMLTYQQCKTVHRADD